jgi:hypothetical protein
MVEAFDDGVGGDCSTAVLRNALRRDERERVQERGLPHAEERRFDDPALQLGLSNGLQSFASVALPPLTTELKTEAMSKSRARRPAEVRKWCVAIGDVIKVAVLTVIFVYGLDRVVVAGDARVLAVLLPWALGLGGYAWRSRT